MDLQLLQTAGKAAALAAERPDQVYDLPAVVVHDLHLERSPGTAAHSGQAVALFLGEEDVLAQSVGDLVLVLGLPTSEGLEQLHLLLDQEMVDHGEVLEAGGSDVAQPCPRLGGDHSRTVARQRGLVGSLHL